MSNAACIVKMLRESNKNETGQEVISSLASLQKTDLVYAYFTFYDFALPKNSLQECNPLDNKWTVWLLFTNWRYFTFLTLFCLWLLIQTSRIFYKCGLCLKPTAIDQESRPASRLRGLGGRRGCRRQPRLLRRHRLGEAKSSWIGASLQAQDCKSIGVNKWRWNPSAEPSCMVTWTGLSLEHDLRLLIHFLPSSCLSCPENAGRRQQLWPGFHSRGAHPHANRRTSDPLHQPGGVHQFLLHLAWTAGGLWFSSLIPLTRRTQRRTFASCSLTAKNDPVFQAVTFPNPVRGSACREVSHAQHTDQGCSARTPKHCCDSRNTVPKRLLKTKWCFYCVLSLDC